MRDDSQEKIREKNGRFHQLLRDQRVLMGISLFLAMVVWLVLSVINGDEQEIPIYKVPVQANFSGTVAEELGLIPFWSGPLTDPSQLTVTVTVKCKRYENITADALKAELVTGNANSAKEHTLAIRVTPKREADRDRFTVVSVTPASIPLYFDHPRTLEFQPTPFLLGELSVPEGYHAEDVLLSKKSVSVTGPATLVDAITTVRAEVKLDKTYRETTVFQNIPIVPVNRNGDTSPYLTVEEGHPEVNATLPVWKRTSLFPSVDFLNVPGMYLGAPLQVTVTPASVQAALPEGRIADDLRYSVGQIKFQMLSPANNRFSFPAEDLKEIRLFDGTDAFTAEVNLDGFDLKRLNLPGAQVESLSSRFGARFEGVNNVAVVGPAEAVAALTDAQLVGEVEIPADAKPGRANLPVAIRVKDREDCWVYGEYTVRATLIEE